MTPKIRLNGAAVALILSVYYFGGGLAFASLAIAVLAHELGHLAAMRSFGGRLNSLKLSMSGFSMSGSGICSYYGELVSLIAGPAAGIVLSLLCAYAGHKNQNSLLLSVSGISLVLSGYNLLPALPLDGGRILELILKKHLGKSKSNKLLSLSGVLTGAVLAGGGLALRSPEIIIGGIWVLIAQTGIVKSLRVM